MPTLWLVSEVFISYSHHDQAYVVDLARHLTQAGLTIWYDYRLGAGDRFDIAIQQQIDMCRALVVVLTPAAVASEWVGREIAYAQDQGKELLPLLRWPCQIPISLVRTHYENVTDGRMPDDRFVQRLRGIGQTAVGPRVESPLPIGPPQDLPGHRRGVRRRTLLLGLGCLVVAGGGVIVLAELGDGPDASSTVTATPIGPPLVGHTDGVGGLVFLSEHVLASGSVDRTARLWDVSDPLHPTQIGQPLTGHTDMVIGIACSPDGKVLATGSGDTTIGLWDVSDPARPVNLPPITAHTDRVLGLAFSPVGRVLASGSRDLTFRLWDMRDPSKPVELGPPVGGNRNSVGKLAFSPNGRLLASGTFFTDVKLWDVSDPGKPVQLSEPISGDDPNNMGSPLFSPDGHTLLTKVDTDLRLWDISNPANPLQDCAPFGPLRSNITEIAFSPSGRSLAVGSGLVVQLWNVVDVSNPVAIGAPLTGHTDGVGSSVFSPSGQLLAVASGDKTIRLWRVSGPV
jgi:WD40 repeat protein